MTNPWMIFVITLIGGAAFLGIDSLCKGTTSCPATLLETLLGSWYALFGFIAALLVAVGAILLVHRQSHEAQKTAKTRRIRGSRAFRAEMIEHLSRLETYAKDSFEICARALDEAKRDSEEEYWVHLRVACPELKPRTEQRLRHPALDIEPDLAEPMNELVRCYDGQRERLAGLVDLLNQKPNPERVIEEHHAEPPLLATLELYLRSTRLFPFARHQSDLIEPLEMDYAAVSVVLIECGIAGRLSPEGRERLLSRFGVSAEDRRPPI